MTTAVPQPDLAAIKGRQRQTWGDGDYAAVAAVIYPTAEVLCDDAGFSAGARVLDVACGSGNVALAATRRAADVVGIDFAPPLLERARERAAAERFAIDFREADAEALPFPDGSFDAVLSAFGVMFAPDQERAAAELLRVCRPGGIIALANWAPTGAVAELFQATARFAPPPPGLRSPMEWGAAARLRELFGDRPMRLNDQVMLKRDPSHEAFVETYRTQYGPTMRAFAGLDEAAAAEYAAALRGIAERHNRATDGTVAAAFAYVTAVVQM